MEGVADGPHHELGGHGLTLGRDPVAAMISAANNSRSLKARRLAPPSENPIETQ